MIPSNRRKSTIISVTSFVIIILVFILFIFGIFQNSSLRGSDIFYNEEKTLENIVIIAIDDSSLQEIGRWPWDRKVYADILNKLQDAKVIGFDISFFEESEDDKIFADTINKYKNVVLNAEYTTFEIKDNKIYGSKLLKPKFSDAEIGYINLINDDDGTVRLMPPKIIGEEDINSFAETIAGKFFDKEMNIPEKSLIRFSGGKNSFTTISFNEVYNGNFEKNYFNNKIVLIGVTAPDFHDMRATPFSYDDLMPGVEVHANAVQTIVKSSYLKQQNTNSVIIFMILFSIIPGLLLFRLKLIYGIIIIILLAVIYFISGFYLFNNGILLNLFYPLLSLVLSFIANTSILYTIEQRHKKGIMDIFGKYVSKEVMNDILERSKNGLSLEGEKKMITILFSDIRSFTTLSENLSSHELVNFLNEYLTLMSKVIMENRGVVDKYIGDAIMAFWGAPLEDKEHAINCCKAALGMRDVLKNFKKEIGIGIGINTGEVIVGNMGSLQRLNYTVIGDAVNSASRLEGLTKAYSVLTIVGENTYNLCKDQFLFRELDLVKVKGKNKPIRVYELMNDSKEDKLVQIKNKFEKGLELYRKQKFDDAIKIFRNIGDETSKVFIDRCEMLKKEKLSNDWDGVFVMKSK